MSTPAYTNTVNIGFSRPKSGKLSLFSDLIRWFQGTKYSHVFLRWKSISGPEVVFEAGGTMVRFLNARFFDEEADTLHTYSIQVTRQEYRALIKLAMESAGTEYGLKQAFGIGLQQIFRLKTNPFADGKASQVCSELVSYFLRDVLKCDIQYNVDTAGPRELKQYIDQHIQDNEDGRTFTKR